MQVISTGSFWCFILKDSSFSSQFSLAGILTNFHFLICCNFLVCLALPRIPVTTYRQLTEGNIVASTGSLTNSEQYKGSTRGVINNLSGVCIKNGSMQNRLLWFVVSLYLFQIHTRYRNSDGEWRLDYRYCTWFNDI